MTMTSNNSRNKGKGLLVFFLTMALSALLIVVDVDGWPFENWDTVGNDGADSLEVELDGDFDGAVDAPKGEHVQVQVQQHQQQRQRQATFRKKKDKQLRIAIVGTSLLYYNDYPNVVEQMFLAAGFDFAKQDVLRSGVGLGPMWEREFQPAGFWSSFCPYFRLYSPGTVVKMLDQYGWDYAVLQDNGDAASDTERRDATVQSLINDYVPLLYARNITPIVFHTWIQRGQPEETFLKNKESFLIYRQTMNEHFLQLYNDATNTNQYSLNQTNTADSINNENSHKKSKQTPPLIQARFAPVGEAFYYLRTANPELYNQLYVEDGKHPTGFGTLLAAYVLFWTVTQGNPPPPQPTASNRGYSRFWWLAGLPRIVLNQKENYPTDLSLFPTDEQAQELWEIARQVYLNETNQLQTNETQL